MTTNGTKTNGTAKQKEMAQAALDSACGDIDKAVQIMEERKVKNLDAINEEVALKIDDMPTMDGKASMLAIANPRNGAKSDTQTLEEQHLDKNTLGKIIFKDQRWDNALNHFKTMDGWNKHIAHSVLRQGAKSFGLWHLEDPALEGLAHQLMQEKTKSCSPALKKWINANYKLLQYEIPDEIDVQGMHTDASAVDNTAPSGKRVIMTKATLDDSMVKNYLLTIEKEKKKWGRVTEWKNTLHNATAVQAQKWGLNILIIVIGIGYAIKVVAQMYPGVMSLLGWPVFFARMGGMMAACWTAVLYFTMSRGLLTTLSSMVFMKKDSIQTFFDAHKDLHIMAGHAIVATGLEHTIAHCIGTVPGILYHSVDEINELIGCANPDTTPGLIAVSFGFLQMPKCPLEEKPGSFTEVLFTTTPGITGTLLILLVAGLGYTASAKKRKEKFETFWYFHNFLLVVWPILLFIHGSNSWIGVGFPLVVFTTSIPFLAYMADRTARFLRYYLYAGTHVKIVETIIRPGKDGAPEGAMTYLRIAKPPHLWRFRPGQYAFICQPEYATFQWHPFTICSGKMDDTVNFLIAGIGDWTQELARRCLASSNEGAPLPMVALDGPYSAPTQSALSKDILVAVGAGVGITPFLSLMSTIIQMIEYDKRGKLKLREAHFYWSTRSADEFLFGREIFTKIAEDPVLRKKIFIHLHVTARESPKDPYSFIFREAIKRQSATDRQFYAKLSSKIHESQTMPDGISTPNCWLNGTQQDILWVGHLTRQYEEIAAEEDIDGGGSASLSHAGHWGQAFLKSKTMTKGMTKGLKAAGTLAEMSANASGFEAAAAEWMVPLVFGRPDFGTEVRSIGKAHPDVDVDIYICGNDAIVQGLQEVACVCYEHAKRDHEEGKASRCQNYSVHYERFG